MSEETKKGFRMPSSYTVLIIIIAVMAALTWIIPAGQYDVNKEGNLIAGTYKEVASNPQGMFSWHRFVRCLDTNLQRQRLTFPSLS